MKRKTLWNAQGSSYIISPSIESVVRDDPSVPIDRQEAIRLVRQGVMIGVGMIGIAISLVALSAMT